MPIDPYALCPCGSGKKVKFCCTDLVGEMEKVQKMLDGNQRHAALEHVEKVLAQHPGRAALLALKVRLLQELGMAEPARATIEEFYAAHPKNPIALAEIAIVRASEHGALTGVEPLQQALAESEDHIAPQVAEALDDMAQLLLADGHFQAAHAHLLLGLRANRENEMALSMLARMNASPQVPLLLKDEPPLLEAPTGVPWKSEFDATMTMARGVLWSAAEERLTALAERAPDAIAVWQNLAIVRSWLGDEADEADALHRVAALQGTKEEAVEAEATAQLIDPAMAADVVDQLQITYPITDIDRLVELAGGDKRLITFPVEAVPRAEGEAPPRAVYMLLDRPLPTTGVNIAMDAVPSVIGRAMIFGRETDREARLEIDASRRDLEAVQALVNELWSGAVGQPAPEFVVGQIPTRQLLFSWNWRLPDDTPPDHVQQLLVRKRRDTILNRWPKTPNALFDGRTPEEVASDPAQRVKLLGALLIIELSLEHPTAEGLVNELRARLGLPTLHPIDPKNVKLDSLPLVRLSRLIVENLSDEELISVYRRSIFVGARGALRKFAHAIIARPSLAEKIDLAAVYANLAALEEDPARALEYIGKARSVTQSAGKSCARWDITELSMRLERGDEIGASELLRHIQTRHGNEPGVGEALLRMLYEAGLVGPDGRPVAGAGLGGGGGAPAQSPGIVVPGAAASGARFKRR